MDILLLIILSIPNPILLILFGMAFALLTLIPPIRNWNRFYARRIVTSLGFALCAIFVYYVLNAYASTEMALYKSHAMNPPVMDKLLDGNSGDVKIELFIRTLRPRLDFKPCNMEQENICEIADIVEIYANEGYAPLKESWKGYWLTVGFTLLWVWIGCLTTVFTLTRIIQVKAISV